MKQIRDALLVIDEFAEVKIAGLRQTDRALLALNECAVLQRAPITVAIEWNGARDRTMPSRNQLHALKFEVAGAGRDFDLVLRTATVVPRLTSADELSRIDNRSAAEPARAQRDLLRTSGKAADGIVARYFDRHISRAISRVLLRFPISPTAFTLAIFPLSIAAFVAFVWGSWAGVLLGAVLVEAQSILDGCDGEIARLKYLESERGRRLDAFCDFLTNVIVPVALGIGLFRRTGSVLYLSEGIISTALIVGRLGPYLAQLLHPDVSRVVTPDWEHAVRDSGSRFLGHGITQFLFELTKRDVVFFAFVLLALFDLPTVILHALFVFAVVSTFLQGTGRKKIRPPMPVAAE